MSAEMKLVAWVSLAMAIMTGGLIYYAKSIKSPTEARAITAASIPDAGQVEREDAPILGDSSAEVAIAVFSDFQCPACAASAPLAEALAKQNPGSVKLAYRFFHLSQHKYAPLTARAALAAAEQGKFWDMHDTLFERQGEWSLLSSESAVNAKIMEYADELGLDRASLETAMASDRVADQIGRDMADGTALRLEGTPTYFVNGVKISSPGLLSQAVEEALRVKRSY